MRISLFVLAVLILAACSPSSAKRSAEVPADAPAVIDGFPAPDRPVASIDTPEWSSGQARDAVDESGQLIRGLEIRPGMAVADIGAGAGYHTLRLSPAVGPKGVVYAEDIVESYISGLRREAERRGLANVRIVVGDPDNPKLPARTMDRAVLVHMYHEIESPYALLWHLAAAMKPDGRVGVIDMDAPTQNHGTPPALLKCEFEAVGYREVSVRAMEGGEGYLAVFAPPTVRPRPADIKPCRLPPA